MRAASTLSLFDRSEVPASGGRPSLVGVDAGGDPDGLRDYQRTAVNNVLREFETRQSTLIVMPTGTGKTQTFGALAKHWQRGRVLVLSHRDELIEQARKRLAIMTGEFVDVEQGKFRSQGARLVSGSVQTLCRLPRLSKFAPDYFGLIIVDEAHHVVAPTYKRVLRYFPGAYKLGVTATPDRGDAIALEMMFQSVAFMYELQQAIDDGWLVPVDVKTVTVGAIDLSAVRTVAGDFNQGQLDAVMSSEEALHGIVRPTLEQSGDRRTIIFTTSVDNAHRMAEIFNRYKPNSARALDGETEFGLRRDILRGHKAGEFQYLVNVGVLTEGYDDPAVACIVMGRPTKSRALAAQMIGRGLRLYPGKASCLVLDFKGTSRHSLAISPANVLAGRWPAEVVERAKDILAKATAPMAVDAAFKAAAAAIQAAKDAEVARRARITASKVEYHVATVDPFRLMGLSGDFEEPSLSQPPSPGQVDVLTKLGIDLKGMTKGKASKLIAQAAIRRQKNLATFKQSKTLSKYGVDGSRMYFATASRVIDAIVANGWRALSPEALAKVIGSRQTGEDG